MALPVSPQRECDGCGAPTVVADLLSVPGFVGRSLLVCLVCAADNARTHLSRALRDSPRCYEAWALERSAEVFRILAARTEALARKAAKEESHG